jgi:hypothetical protein
LNSISKRKVFYKPNEEDEMRGECRTYGRDKKYTQNLVGNPEGKRPLGRRRHRWKDNIGMELREIW